MKNETRLKFRGKIYNFGCYVLLEDAVKARRRGEDTFWLNMRKLNQVQCCEESMYGVFLG